MAKWASDESFLVLLFLRLYRVSFLMVSISLNGQATTTLQANLLQAMKEWQFIITQSAVAVNGEFVPRTSYADIELVDGDEVDVVGAVGGG